MMRPEENTDDWFNLMILHQNRTAHSANNYIPTDYLEDFMHLIFWVHYSLLRVMNMNVS